MVVSDREKFRERGKLRFRLLYFYMLKANAFTHTQKILAIGMWDSHDNHGLLSKKLSVVGHIIHKLDITARLS